MSQQIATGRAETSKRSSTAICMQTATYFPLAAIALCRTRYQSSDECRHARSTSLSANTSSTKIYGDDSRSSFINTSPRPYLTMCQMRKLLGILHHVPVTTQLRSTGAEARIRALLLNVAFLPPCMNTWQNFLAPALTDILILL